MATAYQYDASGYFAGAIDDYGGPIPHNSTREAPEVQEGSIPHWTGAAWEQVENHKGEQGYVNGESYVITDYGPYPDGWSATPPPPTEEDQYNAARAVVYRKYERPYDGASGGILNLVRMTHAAAMMEVPQDPEKLAGISSQYQVELANMKAEYDAIDEQYGVN